MSEMFPTPTPPPKKTEAVEPGVPTQVDVRDTIFESRVQRFEELAFLRPEAERLARAVERTVIKDRKGKDKVYESPLQPARVRRALDAGCGHKCAVHIFT